MMNSSAAVCKKRKLSKIDVETVQSTCNVKDTKLSQLEGSTNHLNGWKPKDFSIKLTKVSLSEYNSNGKVDEIIIESNTKKRKKNKDEEDEKISSDEPKIRRTQRKQKALERFDSALFCNSKSKEPKSVQIITPIQMANIIWTELTTKSFDIEIGMVVCAKMPTFWPWPAQVINIKGQRVRVRFFGDLKEGNVKIFQCVPIFHCHLLIMNYLKTIEENTRKLWYPDLVAVLDASNRSKVKKFPLKKLYLQAIKDFQIYIGSEISLLI